MKKNWIVFALAAITAGLLINACQSHNLPSGASCAVASQPACPTGANVMSVLIGPQTVCGQNGYVNEPCVTVTICHPGQTGPANCDTISNILLDTGSYGLRVYSSLLVHSAPVQVTDGMGHPVAECAQFGTGAEWGPVATADVYLASEPAAPSVSIQLINPSFDNASYTGISPNDVGPSNTNCNSQTLEPNPADDGFNGILGVGLFGADCGPLCASGGVGINGAVGQYYACASGVCGNNTVNVPTSGCGTGSEPDCGIDGIPLAVGSQVTNPIALISGTDNNGIAVRIPDPGANGAEDITGCAMIGVNTQSNNTAPSTATVFPADGNYDANFGNFLVTDSGTQYDGFIDSGSNGIFFENGPDACSASSGADGFYCPTTTTLETASNAGYTGSSTGAVCFAVADATTLINTGNLAFDNIAGEASGYFDWGLPFFMGRTVYVGIMGQPQTIGTPGPFWAY